jgi:hypothetical protein
MIDKINVNPIHLDPAAAGGQNPRPETAKNGHADATLQIDFQRLIEQAAQEPPADADAVQKARELLESGRLDSQANIKAAAEDIASFGV